MNIERFEKLARARFEYCLSLMIGQKHKEYSRNDDKLHNFKAAAIIDRESPERALWGMFKKHFISVKDIVDDIEYSYRIMDHDADVKLPSEDKLSEKISDSVDYFVLLEALVTERIETRVKPQQQWTYGKKAE